MRVLVTGGSGQLGSEIGQLLRMHACCQEVLLPSRQELDLANSESINSALHLYHPDVVVNCGAWTAVDLAESCSDIVMNVNATAVDTLAISCADLGAEIVQVSTDYVFGRDSRGIRNEDDPTSPTSVYGISKVQAEERVAQVLPRAHCIVRTAWLYGVSVDNFVYKILSRLSKEQTVHVVNDQYGSPTWARDAARRIVGLIEGRVSGRVPPGTYHAVNSGSATWYDFAHAIARYADFDSELVVPVSSRSLNRPAPRPAHAVLGDERAIGAGLSPMRHWTQALKEAVPRLRQEWPLV